jgi:hypothetical protein
VLLLEGKMIPILWATPRHCGREAPTLRKSFLCKAVFQLQPVNDRQEGVSNVLQYRTR